MGGMLTSQATDTPVATSDVAACINSSLHYLFLCVCVCVCVCDSLQVAPFQPLLTMDIEDRLYHGSISNA
jgi:hypothetical protein